MKERHSVRKDKEGLKSKGFAKGFLLQKSTGEALPSESKPKPKSGSVLFAPGTNQESNKGPPERHNLQAKSHQSEKIKPLTPDHVQGERIQPGSAKKQSSALGFRKGFLNKSLEKGKRNQKFSAARQSVPNTDNSLLDLEPSRPVSFLSRLVLEESETLPATDILPSQETKPLISIVDGDSDKQESSLPGQIKERDSLSAKANLDGNPENVGNVDAGASEPEFLVREVDMPFRDKSEELSTHPNIENIPSSTVSVPRQVEDFLFRLSSSSDETERAELCLSFVRSFNGNNDKAVALWNVLFDLYPRERHGSHIQLLVACLLQYDTESMFALHRLRLACIQSGEQSKRLRSDALILCQWIIHLAERAQSRNIAIDIDWCIMILPGLGALLQVADGRKTMLARAAEQAVIELVSLLVTSEAFSSPSLRVSVDSIMKKVVSVRLGWQRGQKDAAQRTLNEALLKDWKAIFDDGCEGAFNLSFDDWKLQLAGLSFVGRDDLAGYGGLLHSFSTADTDLPEGNRVKQAIDLLIGEHVVLNTPATSLQQRIVLRGILVDSERTLSVRRKRLDTESRLHLKSVLPRLIPRCLSRHCSSLMFNIYLAAYGSESQSQPLDSVVDSIIGLPIAWRSPPDSLSSDLVSQVCTWFANVYKAHTSDTRQLFIRRLSSVLRGEPDYLFWTNFILNLENEEAKCSAIIIELTGEVVDSMLKSEVFLRLAIGDKTINFACYHQVTLIKRGCAALFGVDNKISPHFFDSRGFRLIAECLRRCLDTKRLAGLTDEICDYFESCSDAAALEPIYGRLRHELLWNCADIHAFGRLLIAVTLNVLDKPSSVARLSVFGSYVGDSSSYEDPGNSMPMNRIANSIHEFLEVVVSRIQQHDQDVFHSLAPLLLLRRLPSALLSLTRDFYSCTVDSRYQELVGMLVRSLLSKVGRQSAKEGGDCESSQERDLVAQIIAKVLPLSVVASESDTNTQGSLLKASFADIVACKPCDPNTATGLLVSIRLARTVILSTCYQVSQMDMKQRGVTKDLCFFVSVILDSLSVDLAHTVSKNEDFLKLLEGIIELLCLIMQQEIASSGVWHYKEPSVFSRLRSTVAPLGSGPAMPELFRVSIWRSFLRLLHRIPTEPSSRILEDTMVWVAKWLVDGGIDNVSRSPQCLIVAQDLFLSCLLKVKSSSCLTYCGLEVELVQWCLEIMRFDKHETQQFGEESIEALRIMSTKLTVGLMTVGGLQTGQVDGLLLKVIATLDTMAQHDPQKGVQEFAGQIRELVLGSPT